MATPDHVTWLEDTGEVIETADGRGVEIWVLNHADDPAILEEIYLAALGHEPDATRRLAILDHVARSPDRRKAWEDVSWAILNSKEFLLRH